MSESTVDKLRSIYTDLDNRREFAIDEAIDDLHELIEVLKNPDQQSVIRTVNGEIDDVWIENVDVHLERTSHDMWSVVINRGEQKLIIEWYAEPTSAVAGWNQCEITTEITQDTIGCEREEQGE